MENISAHDALKARILNLEIQRDQEKEELKAEFGELMEALKPVNLIRSTLRDVKDAPDIRNHVMDSLVGMAAGWLSKKVVIGSTHNPLKRVLGSVLQMGVSKVVRTNFEDIKDKAVDLFRKFTKKDRKGLQNSRELNGAELYG